MFGRDWEAAEATIVSRRLVAEGHNSGSGGGMGAGGLDGIGGGRPTFWEEYEYTADVRPGSGAAPFRATINEPRNGIHFHTPDVGQLVQVKFNTKDQKVKFDHSDPVVFGKQAVAEAHSEDQDVDAAAGPGGFATQAEEFAKNAAEVRARAEEFRERVDAASRGGGVIDSHDDENPGSVFGSGAWPASHDPVEQLEKLADLRDRGVLTAAEFEAQKAKILDEG